jgi:hypothetical protein
MFWLQQLVTASLLVHSPPPVVAGRHRATSTVTVPMRASQMPKSAKDAQGDGGLCQRSSAAEGNVPSNGKTSWW